MGDMEDHLKILEDELKVMEDEKLNNVLSTYGW